MINHEATLSFSDFKKEIQGIGLKNPKIKSNSELVKIRTEPFFDDIIFQLILLALSSLVFFYDWCLFPSIIACGLFCYYLYTNFIALNTFKIDFTTKTFAFRNKIFILELTRKLFRIKNKIVFSDIISFDTKEGTLIKTFPPFSKNRVYLILKTKYDSDVIISQFKKESDAITVASILKKFILQKEKIIS